MKILEEHEKFISVLEGDSTEDVLQIIAEHVSKAGSRWRKERPADFVLVKTLLKDSAMHIVSLRI